MPWSIQDYKTDPRANGAINSTNISDTGMPSGLNDALRQLMTDIAESGLVNPELYISTDPENALKVGSDGMLHADPTEIKGGTPVQLISTDSGNKLAPGTDGKLLVTLSAVLSIPWVQITGKPSKVKPSPHAATHGPGGADVIPTFFPSEAIALWYGEISAIPTGWVVCDGFNGSPDLRSKMLGGAGGSALPNPIGGYASQTISARTDFSGGGLGQDSHTHALTGHTATLSKNYSAGMQTYFQLGYAAPASQSQVSVNMTDDTKHLHPITLHMESLPPYRALHYIMKT